MPIIHVGRKAPRGFKEVSAIHLGHGLYIMSIEPEKKSTGKEMCRRCDGCGWYEGGAALQTTCEKCDGTGLVVGVPQAEALWVVVVGPNDIVYKMPCGGSTMSVVKALHRRLYQERGELATRVLDTKKATFVSVGKHDYKILSHGCAKAELDRKYKRAVSP